MNRIQIFFFALVTSVVAQNTHLDASTTSIAFGMNDTEDGPYYLNAYFSSLGGKTANIALSAQLTNVSIPEKTNGCPLPTYTPFSFTKTGGNLQGNITSQTSVQISVAFDPKSYSYLGGASCADSLTSTGAGTYSATLSLSYTGSQQGSPSGASGSFTIPITATAQVKAAPVGLEQKSGMDALDVVQASASLYLNKVADVRILDALGREVVNQYSVRSISIEGLSSGIYFVHAASGMQNKVLLVQKNNR